MEKTKRNEVKERIYSALSSTGSTWLTTAETTKICEDFALSEKDFIEVLKKNNTQAVTV